MDRSIDTNQSITERESTDSNENFGEIKSQESINIFANPENIGGEKPSKTKKYRKGCIIAAIILVSATGLIAILYGLVFPRQPGYHLGLGANYLKFGDYDRAIAEFTQAINMDPQYTAAYLGRGESYSKSGDLERAIADYNQAIQLDPSIDAAYCARGMIYAQIGDLDRAIADFDQAIQLNPNDRRAYNERGLAYGSEQPGSSTG